MDQSNLLKSFKEFVDKSRPNTTKGKNKKEILLRLVNALYEGQELTINAFKSGIFPIKSTQGKELKILTPKQMLQRLPIAFTHVKAGNASKHLLNEVTQIIYSLY